MNIFLHTYLMLPCVCVCAPVNNFQGFSNIFSGQNDPRVALSAPLQESATQFLGSQPRPAPWPTTCRQRASFVAPWSSPPSPPSWESSCSAVSTPTCRGPSWWVQKHIPVTVQTPVGVHTQRRFTTPARCLLSQRWIVLRYVKYQSETEDT